MKTQTTQPGQPVTPEISQPNVGSKTVVSELLLCRLRNGMIFERPSDEKQLIKLIKKSGSYCTCREQNKLAYRTGECLYKHGHFDVPENTISWIPPTKLMMGLKYEALDLAHYTALFIRTPEHNMSPKQKNALYELRYDPLEPLGAVDVADIAVKGMLHLLELVSDLFFFSSLVVDFEWKDVYQVAKTPGYYARGVSYKTRTGYTIIMDPLNRKKNQDGPRGRKDERLKSLIHVAIHVFLNMYACQKCPTMKDNVNNAGNHGRAFMQVSKAVQDAFASFGRPNQRMANTSDWLGNWNEVHSLPSIHDIEDWGWCEPSESSDPAALPQ